MTCDLTDTCHSSDTVSRDGCHSNAVSMDVLQEYLGVPSSQRAGLVWKEYVNFKMSQWCQKVSSHWLWGGQLTFRKASFCSMCLLMSGSSCSGRRSPAKHQSSSRRYSCSRLSRTPHTWGGDGSGDIGVKTESKRGKHRGTGKPELHRGESEGQPQDKTQDTAPNSHFYSELHRTPTPEEQTERTDTCWDVL